MLASLSRDPTDQRLAKRGDDKKYEKNEASNYEIGYQRNALIEDANAGVPGVGEIDGHAALLMLIKQHEGGVEVKDSEATGTMPCR